MLRLQRWIDVRSIDTPWKRGALAQSPEQVDEIGASARQVRLNKIPPKSKLGPRRSLVGVPFTPSLGPQPHSGA
ncbi:hypothetical protein ACGF8B_36765 [Streptomyces sp. NPDC047917]|uniref:hypothetical protein n=1 Tax=Streptomyces sp. NPDC047917 TaxID=3365491 RepID=UPI003719E1C1